MATGFAEVMDGEASEIGCLMEKESGTGWKRKPYRQDNVKTWYNRPGMFESRAKRVFLGVHPAGEWCDANAPEGHLCRCPEWHEGDGQYNYWICEDWSHANNGTRHQQHAQAAFKHIYGEDGINLLRETPSFNVCPIRTPTATPKDIPLTVWRRSEMWAKDVLDIVRPSTIICNGSSESVRSAWTMLKKKYGLCEIDREKLGGNASLKFGVGKVKPLKGTKVLALPHLSYHGGWSSLRDSLKSAKCKYALD